VSGLAIPSRPTCGHPSDLRAHPLRVIGLAARTQTG
jgi:hypothetical protein